MRIMMMNHDLGGGESESDEERAIASASTTNPSIATRYEIQPLPTWASRHHRLRHSSLPSRRQRSGLVGYGGGYSHRSSHHHYRHHYHHRHQQQNHLPTLFFLVKNRSWDDVVRRCQTHAHEISVQDDISGNTPLHVACQLDPPSDIVQCLTTPESFKPNALGATPLHVAATHRCSATSLQLLIDIATSFIAAAENASCHPTAALTHMGRAPIHSACMSFRGLDLEAFSVLLESTLKHGNRNRGVITRKDCDMKNSSSPFLDDFMDEEDYLLAKTQTEKLASDLDSPSDIVNVMALRDTKGYTPLGLLFRRYRQRVKSVISIIDKIKVNNDLDEHNQRHPSPVANPEFRTSVASALTVQADLGTLWGKARILVARLTEERLQREGHLLLHKILSSSVAVKDGVGVAADLNAATTGPPPNAADADGVVPIAIATSSLLTTCHSPAELAVSQGAASWALEQHYSDNNCITSDEEGVDEFMTATASTTKDMTTLLTKTIDDTHARHLRRKFRIVHASVGLTGYGCPPEMIRLAVSMNPHQVREMDEEGNLPIHIVSSASSFVGGAFEGHEAEVNAANTRNIATAGSSLEDDNNSVISESMQSLLSSATANAGTPTNTRAFDKVIKFMLRHYPQGVRVPQGKTGTLPLVLAAQVGRRTWNDGVATLLHAYPPALHSRKLKLSLSLYPHIFARINEHPSRSPPISVFDQSISDLHCRPEDGDQPPRSGAAPSTVANGAGVETQPTNRWSYIYYTSPRTLHVCGAVDEDNDSVQESQSITKNTATGSAENYASVKLGDTTSQSPFGVADRPVPVVRPRVATTIFELLKTKPDLVSYATSNK